MNVIFSERAFAAVLAETTEKIKTETGGLFLGTVIEDTWYIIEAIDPGPNSIFEFAYFEYDQKYTQHLINKIANLYNKKLDLIGLWHRHPGSFDQFSSTDDGTNSKYASMRSQGAISALVNIDPDFRITMYHVDRPCKYRRISYEVGNSLIPKEYLEYKPIKKFNSLMNGLLFSQDGAGGTRKYKKYGEIHLLMNDILPLISKVVIPENSFLNIKSNEEIQESVIDEIIDDVSFMADVLGIETAMSLKEFGIEVFQEKENIVNRIEFKLLDYGTVICYQDNCYKYHRGLIAECVDKFRKTSQNGSAERVIVGNDGLMNSVFRMIKIKRNEDK